MDTYEKEYKDALKRAKKLYEQGTITETLSYIFPELAESEDEKIRKSIYIYLDWLDGRKDYAPRGEYTIMDMISWLEKQGQCQVKESAISQHENKTCKETNDSLTSKDDMMIEETLYFLREYQQSNRCKDENGMQNSVTCEKWLKSLKERLS